VGIPESHLLTIKERKRMRLTDILKDNVKKAKKDYNISLRQICIAADNMPESTYYNAIKRGTIGGVTFERLMDAIDSLKIASR
jgi:adenylyl- and sulfurtransferase ThiI